MTSELEQLPDCVEGKDPCGEPAPFHCNLCEGDFCQKHYKETHPKNRCIHY